MSRYKLPNAQFNSYSLELRELLLNMISKVPEDRFDLKQILGHPILGEMNGLG